MPNIEIFCPATQTDITLTLTMQRKPEACHNHSKCKKSDQMRCLLRALKITGGKSI